MHLNYYFESVPIIQFKIHISNCICLKILKIKLDYYSNYKSCSLKHNYCFTKLIIYFKYY